jgi:ribosomal-protein-alanine N-acetyltransferase
MRVELELQTSRLSLRTVTASDDKFIFQLVNSPGWLKFIGQRGVNSQEDAVSYIQRIQNTPNLTYWVVKVISTGEPTGIISFIKRDYLEHFDIGFAFLPEFTGKGYAYEAAHAILCEVRKKTNQETILATTVPGNTESIRLLAKLGMHFEREIQVDSEKLHVYSTRNKFCQY